MTTILYWVVIIGIAMIAVYVLQKIWKYILTFKMSLVSLGIGIIVTAIIVAIVYWIGQEFGIWKFIRLY